MDLHAWIAQQVDKVEASARERLIGHSITVAPCTGNQSVSGTITGVQQVAEGLQFTVDQYGVDSSGPAPAEATAMLRRCEADRRILARHCVDRARSDDPIEATACKGCGTYGDMDLAETENLNDCPELLDLAHAHGLTNEILAGLDRPQPPPPKHRTDGRLGLADIHATPPITTSDVPAALRGTHWKP